MANTGHMDDDHSDGRTRADIFGSPGRTLHLREGEEASARTDEGSDAEARMRAALGLFGTRPSPQGDRNTHHEPHGAADRRPAGGSAAGSRRHRFVQDGEVPVSVVRGRQTPRPPAAETERQADGLAQERQLRVEAERRLADKEIQLRSLQTRIGHAELERDQARAEAREWREKAEAALAEMQVSAHAVPPAGRPETRVEPHLEEVAAPELALGEPAAPSDFEPQPRVARRGRRRPDEGQLEFDDPEPVKWWL